MGAEDEEKEAESDAEDDTCDTIDAVLSFHPWLVICIRINGLAAISS